MKTAVKVSPEGDVSTPPPSPLRAALLLVSSDRRHADGQMVRPITHFIIVRGSGLSQSSQDNCSHVSV